jgi:hypothetical protein
MNKDFPNTVLLWEHTRNDESGGADIFEPDVKVLLSWKDVEAAVEVGAVVPSEAYTLWAYWAAPGSPVRLAAQAIAPSMPGPAAASESVAAASSGFGGAAARAASPLHDELDETLEMQVPGQSKKGQGVPSELRVVLLVVVVALVVWTAGKVMRLW